MIKLRVVGCSGGSVKDRFLSCFLLDDTIALDAGGLTGPLTLDEQLRVRHVIVTHTHLDHNCGLPFFIDNVFGRIEEPIVVHGTEAVVESLRSHMFNDVMWPDFTKLPSAEKPTLRFEPVAPETPFTIGRLTFTAIEVEHLIPTVGFLVEDDESAVLYTSDTGPTERVWELASAHPRLKGVITEVSFTNEDSELARLSGHMTSKLLAGELAKLKTRVPVLITHTKPGHFERVAEELAALELDDVAMIEQGKTYTF